MCVDSPSGPGTCCGTRAPPETAAGREAAGEKGCAGVEEWLVWVAMRVELGFWEEMWVWGVELAEWVGGA